MRYLFLALICAACLLAVRLTDGADQKGQKTEISVVKIPAVAGQNRHYISNREPLAPSPLIKLPIGTIEPKG